MNNQSIHLDYKFTDLSQKKTHRYRVDSIVSLTRDVLQGIPSPKILDVGCGRGELMEALRNELDAEVYGLDIDNECLRMSGKHGQVWMGTAVEVFTNNAYLTNFFDLIISSHSIEHMPSPKEEIKALWNMSKSNVMIAVPNPHKLFNVLKICIAQKIPEVNRGHLYSWDAPHLKNFLENHCGLTIQVWRGDVVKIIPRGKLRTLIINSSFFNKLEGYYLPKKFPRLANSLIVLCTKH